MSGGGAHRLDTQHCISGSVHYNCEGLCLPTNSKLVRPHHMIDTSTLPSQWPCVCQTHLVLTSGDALSPFSPEV